jgi:hypothetical protein
MEALRSFEAPVIIYESTRCEVPEYLSFNQTRSE